MTGNSAESAKMTTRDQLPRIESVETLPLAQVETSPDSNDGVNVTPSTRIARKSSKANQNLNPSPLASSPLRRSGTHIGTVSVLVSTSMGTYVNARLQKHATIEEVRVVVSGLLSSENWCDCTLIFNDRELRDTETVAGANICDGNTIFVTPRLRSGLANVHICEDTQAVTSALGAPQVMTDVELEQFLSKHEDAKVEMVTGPNGGRYLVIKVKKQRSSEGKGRIGKSCLAAGQRRNPGWWSEKQVEHDALKNKVTALRQAMHKKPEQRASVTAVAEVEQLSHLTLRIPGPLDAEMEKFLCASAVVRPRVQGVNSRVRAADASRCGCCSKKLGIMVQKCKCGACYCPKHRLPHDHQCGYNYGPK